MEIRKSAVGMFLAVAALLTGCYPPGVQYPYTKLVTERRATLKDGLLELLPEAQRKLPAAQAEAEWLADTAYKAAAGISRVNDSHFPGWAGNALINARLQDRGLCWHYQNDMYRELRRRPLKFFRVGCCVRDREGLSEHNCVYVAAAGAEWPDCWVLDAWMWNGRLKVDKGTELNQRRWADLPDTTKFLAAVYPEGHTLPVEHWAVVRDYKGDYSYYRLPESRCSKQYARMYDNCVRGQEEHPDSPTNY